MAKQDDDNKRDKWLRRLADEDKAHSEWRKRAKDADKAFCDYQSDAKAPLAPLFATTINLIHGRIYGRPPKPDIRKRHPNSAYAAPSAAVPAQAQQAPPGQPQPAPGLQGSTQGNTAGQAGGVPPGGGGVPLGGTGQPSSSNPMAIGGGAPGLGGAITPVADSIADDNTIAMALERCIDYTIDSTLFDDDGHQAVNDFLVSGLGIAKVELETETEAVPVINPATGDPIKDEDGITLTQDVITYQCLHLRHFHNSQFSWEPCKDWRRVGWVAFKHYLTKDEIEKTFDVELDVSGKRDDSGNSNARESGAATAVSPPQMDKYEGVYVVSEIWDKRNKTRLFVSDCYDDVLAEDDDPLELQDFFPCPRPMMTLQNGRELVPCPEYWQCAALFDQANEIADRVYHITKQVKDIAFYDDSFTDLQKLPAYDDGDMIPVKNLLDKMRALNGRASADSVLYQVDMTAKVQVLGELMQQFETIKDRIYQIYGISDIQQGVTNPGDTATAQNIKNEWADIRTGQRVQKVALFFRDVFRIFAEIVANKFDVAQVKAMCGIDLSETQIETMRNDLARNYVVDVQDDSTMVEKDSQDVQELGQFLQTITPFLEQMLPAVKNGIMPADLGKEILSLIVDRFKIGENLQQAVDALPSTVQQLSELTSTAQQAQQQVGELQKQLQGYQAGEEARKNADTQASVAEKQVDTAAKAQSIHTDGIKEAAAASQASRQDIMEGAMTGIA